MTKLSKTSFAVASNPALEKVGEFTGMALGKIVTTAAPFLQAMGLLASDKDAQAFPLLAQSSKGVKIQVGARHNTAPYASRELEEEKPTNTGAFMKGARNGFAKETAKAKNAPPRPKPGLAPT